MGRRPGRPGTGPPGTRSPLGASSRGRGTRARDSVFADCRRDCPGEPLLAGSCSKLFLVFRAPGSQGPPFWEATSDEDPDSLARLAAPIARASRDRALMPREQGAPLATRQQRWVSELGAELAGNPRGHEPGTRDSRAETRGTSGREQPGQGTGQDGSPREHVASSRPGPSTDASAATRGRAGARHVLVSARGARADRDTGSGNTTRAGSRSRVTEISPACAAGWQAAGRSDFPWRWPGESNADATALRHVVSLVTISRA